MNEPKYPQNKIYGESYKKGLKKQEETINKRIKELDDIVSKTKGAPQARAETEIITKIKQLKKLKIYIIK